MTLPVLRNGAWIILMLVTLAACSQNGPVATAVPGTPTPVTPAASATPQPTSTPTQAPARVVLVAAKEADPILVKDLKAVLDELAPKTGLQVEQREAIQPADVAAGWKIVVFASAPADLEKFSAAGPQTQFVVVSSGELKTGQTVNVIRQRVDNQAFAAGMLAVMFTTDWRSGALLTSDQPTSQVFQDSFMVGARYFCGRCMPGWPLGMIFPQTAALPAASDGAAWQTAANDLLVNKKADVYFISPEAAKAEVFKFFTGKKLILYGAQTPPENMLSQWAVTVRLSPVEPLRAMWPSLLEGKGGMSANAQIKLDDINRNYLGQGKENYLMGILAELQKGLINPQSVPVN